jgi:type 1 fimbria pilin
MLSSVAFAGGSFVRSLVLPVLLAFTALAPAVALATTVDPALVPDGTYVVKVEKVEDTDHLLVMMQNGVETTLVATGQVDFGKVKSNDTIKISLVKGKVPVYLEQ